MMTRRRWLTTAAAALTAAAARGRARAAAPERHLELIEAPNHLGLRPPRPGVEPGAWKAPAALVRAGLADRLHPERQVRLPRPAYSTAAPPGTRIRNGPALRQFSLRLADAVAAALGRGALPLVLGGDCSNLLGCLVGLRRAGGRGLVHVDGHSDFSHPGNYDTRRSLGAVAGMDLALATGRGERLLTEWPGVAAPLVADADVVQLGEREAGDADYAYHDIERTAITRLTAQTVKAEGVAAAVARVLARLGERGLGRAWLHVDLDVLDQAVMPAVDSPGSPGLGYAELATLVRTLIGSGRVAGLDVGIYDPDRDPHGRYAAELVACLASALAD